jgi:hypothetical protein
MRLPPIVLIMLMVLSLLLLPQCAAITADFKAARLAETERVLQELAQHRADSRAEHELWLASRCAAVEPAHIGMLDIMQLWLGLSSWRS